MRRFERNEFGYPYFEAAGPDLDRRRFGDVLERILRQRTRCMVPTEQIAEWEHEWIDLGGEG